MKSNIFHTNYNSNAPTIGKDMAKLYSIATFTLSILCFIYYWFVSKLISGGDSVPSLFILPMGNMIYLYLFIMLTYTVYRYCVTSGWFPISLGFSKDTIPLYNCFFLFGTVSLLLLHYETKIDSLYYLLLFGSKMLLYIGDIITPIIFWCKLLLSILYLVDKLGIYNFYGVYKDKLALCNYALKQLKNISHVISYLINIARLAGTIIYVISVGLFIYKCMQSSLSYLDWLQFILFVYSLYKQIHIFLTTQKVYRNYMFYMKLLFYLIAMIIFLPAFLKVASVIFTIVNIIGKGKGKAPEPPSSGSNSSPPSSPPFGPNPPPGTDSVPLHDNSNKNQDEEEDDSSQTNTWQAYNTNAWEKASQENGKVVAGPSETAKERKSRLARERWAARTPEQIAKDLEKGRAYKRERTQDQLKQIRERNRIAQKKFKDKMSQQKNEQHLAKATEQDKNYLDSLDEPVKEITRQYNGNSPYTLAEVKRLDYEVRKEKSWKKKLKKNQKKDKDDKTSKKK